jgi:glycosyltransferase involved in cell wall biosynthesis
MKVLHVIPALASRYGGPSVAAIGLCTALQRRGVESLLVCTDADGPGRLPIRTEVETEFGGARVVFFGCFRGESLKLSPRLASWLRGNVRSFDIVHIHSVFSHPSLAAGRACRRQSVPYVVRPLGHLDRWSLRQHAYRKRLFLVLGGDRMLRRAAAIHWTAGAEQEAAAGGLGALPGFVIPLGVDDSLFSPRRESFRAKTPQFAGRPYLLFLSRLHPKKNVEALIEAFGRLEGSGHHLVIAGNGEESYVTKLRARADEAAPGRVTFAGWLDGDRKRSALQGADLFVLPSFQENFGIAAAEAMAAGVPVVLGEGVNLASEVREKGAGWVTAPTVDALTAGLREALASGDERRRRGEAAGRLAEERFRWSSVAEALESQYESILRGWVRAEGPQSQVEAEGKQRR